MNTDFDIAVVGSGFGGSLLAMIARRLGYSVILLERGKHPRFAIGESSTPLANLLLEELATRYQLPRVLPLTKWGTWQQQYPQIGCGLKRGFTFYHHTLGQEWAPLPNRTNDLLVAASPHDHMADTHWFRPDFDAFLASEAQAMGVEYLDEVKLETGTLFDCGMELLGARAGKPFQVRARLVFDASGPRGFLHRTLRLDEHSFQHLPPTQSLYSHFSGVQRWDELFQESSTPPYPVDDAAVHHIFEGGWMWVLRFNNGLTSVGVAAIKTFTDRFRFAEGAPAWGRLLEQLPSVRKQFEKAAPQRPFAFVSQLGFRSALVAGQQWALLPSAAGFIDPLLSSGFPLTLLGVSRLASILESNPNPVSLADGLEKYARQTASELDLAEQMVASLYRHCNDFELFSALSLLYFAAASFTEVVKRLGHPERAGSHFLLGDHEPFGENCRRCFALARQPMNANLRGRLIDSIYQTIAPVDIAGLGDRKRFNRYPVRGQDLLENGWKAGGSPGEIRELLVKCGLGT